MSMFGTMPPHLTTNRSLLESTSHSQSRAIALNHSNIALCLVLGRYSMYVDTVDQYISPHLMLDGYWESWVTLAMAKIIKPNWVCTDVGSCMGYYTILMADAVGPGGKVFA